MSKATKGITKTPSITTPKAASRVQRATALTHGGVVKSDSVVIRRRLLVSITHSNDCCYVNLEHPNFSFLTKCLQTRFAVFFLRIAATES